MNRRRNAVFFILPFLLGCSSSGPVPMGKDTYMLSNTGAWSWSSGSALKGDLFREANDFCQSQGKQLMPINTNSIDGGFSNFAHAEVQFRCLANNDPELKRPNLQPMPNVRIENMAK